MDPITITTQQPITLATADRAQHQETVTLNSHAYAGEFNDGHPEGEGVYTFPNGDEYDGFFEEGTFNGKGTYTFEDG